MIRILELQRRSEGKRQLSSSYLWRVAHSVLVDEIRRVRRRREQPLDDAPLTRQRAGGPPNPEKEAEAREISQAIGGCLSRLVRPRRLAVTLHLQGHSVPEAARLLRYGRKRTENLVYRGLSDLRRCLASKGLEP
jgi:RNA polymerase sigma-70 factor (ECF subfamily)